MGSSISAKELLSAVAATGYFSSPDTQQETFRHLVEDRLNVSLGRAIDILTESGLAIFSYVGDGHPSRDSIDRWQLQVTSAGESELSSGSNSSFKPNPLRGSA